MFATVAPNLFCYRVKLYGHVKLVEGNPQNRKCRGPAPLQWGRDWPLEIHRKTPQLGLFM